MKLKRVTHLLSLPFLLLVGSTQAEFSGDPGQGGPMTYCKYFHTMEGVPVVPTDHYASKVVFGTTCPDISPEDEEVVNPDGSVSLVPHTIVGPMPVSDPRYNPTPRIMQKVDNHDCQVTVESGNAV